MSNDLSYQDRVKVEKEELDKKIYDLGHFIGTDLFNKLLAGDRSLLAKQYLCMLQYSAILQARIKRFEVAS